ncbi:MAG: ATP-grasp domain-containing protein, partial [Chloroflexi bacterium]|nr:ATP-grasp domain-containing protein [Chloroflexota bacterium]
MATTLLPERRMPEARSRFRGDAAGALVIGGDYRGLGIVRSLGRQGIPVWVLQDHHRVATHSRYTRRSLPWLEGDETEQRDYLLELCCRHSLEGWALFPTGDAAAAFVARHHDALAERFRLTTPPWGVVRFAHDKRLTYQLAAELGLDHPWTRYPTGPEELAALDCAFPVLLKPAWKEHLNPFTQAKA